MRTTGYIILLLIAAIATGCEKELDFKYHDIAPILVIEGTLSQHGAEVALTLTTPMDEPMDRTHLTDATVTIADLDDGTSSVLAPDADGVFRNPQPGLPGHRYRLEVERGSTILGSECAMPAPVEIKGMTFNWIKMPYDDVAVLSVSFTDSDPSAAGDCFWVKLLRNGEHYMWSTAKDNLAGADGVIDKVFMTSRRNLDKEDDDTALREGDVVEALVYPISRAMHDYLESIASDSSGPEMFSGGLALGYFMAAPESRGSTVFHPDDIEYQ